MQVGGADPDILLTTLGQAPPDLSVHIAGASVWIDKLVKEHLQELTRAARAGVWTGLCWKPFRFYQLSSQLCWIPFRFIHSVVVSEESPVGKNAVPSVSKTEAAHSVIFPISASETTVSGKVAMAPPSAFT
jgi:hypothetical protein